jgi:hypothetical protein
MTISCSEPRYRSVVWDRAVSKQKLDLFQITAVLATKLRARPAQIVCPEVLDSNLLRRLLDDRPNRPVAQLVADQLPALGERPRPAAVLDLRRNRPGVDSLLDPDTLPCANSALKVSLHGASQNARSSSN